MEFHECIKKYEEKTGEKFYWDTSEFNHLEINNDNTFLMYGVVGETFWIGMAYGNGNKWKDFCINKAKEFGCKYIKTLTRRNPMAFVKKWGAQIEWAYCDNNIMPEYILSVEVK